MMTGIERNFGGLPAERPLLLSEFQVDDMKQSCSVISLIQRNIEDQLARHLMLITTGESVLGILEQNLNDSGRQNREVIFGSQFEEDLTDDYNYRILNRIILCMEQGLVLILKDLENIYGSLYDMLNQKYTIIGKKKNCRVALGPYSNPICHVADSFRCIVLVDDSKLNYSDPPFLNRFEKQYLRFSDIIRQEQRGFIQKLGRWVQDVSVLRDFDEDDAFPIFSEDMVSSLILQKYMDESNEDEVVEKCKFDLLWIIKPEVIVRLAENSCDSIVNEREHLVGFYMKLPVHRGINGLLEAQINNEQSTQCLVFTNSNIHTKVLQNVNAFKIQIDKLGAFKSEKQLSSRMRAFWLESKTDILFLQCSAVDDQRHIMLAKSVIEKFRQEFLSTKQEGDVKHVYLIVHLDRSKGLSTILSQINFLTNWKLVTLDSLEDPITPLPELCSQSLHEALHAKRPLNAYIKEQLFWSFTRIKYKQEGRNVDNLTTLITKIKNSYEFLETLDELIVSSIERDHPDIEDRDWQVRVACNRRSLQTASSFIDALESHILDIISVHLVKYIFVMEKELMLDTFFVNDGCFEERRNVWRTLISREEQLSTAKLPDQSGPECYVCGATAIELKMPFSKYIFEAVEATSDEYLNSTKLLKSACGLDPEDSLPGDIFCELQKKQELIVDQKLPRLIQYDYYISAMEDYFEDFCNIISVKICPSLVSSVRIHYTKMILADKTSFAERDLLEGIVSLHIAIWNHFTVFSPHLHLFETCRDILTIGDLQLLTKRQTHIKNLHCEENEEDLEKGDDDEDVGAMGGYVVHQSTVIEDELSANPSLIQKEDKPNVIDADVINGTFDKDLSQDNNLQNIKEKDDEEEEEAELKDVLVKMVCQKMLPGKTTVEHYKTLKEWLLKSNEVSVLVSKINPASKFIHHLRICSEVAKTLILPNELDYSLLHNLANCLLNEQDLDSSLVFEAILDIIDKGVLHSSTKCQQVLANYCLRCLLSDPESEAMSFFLNIVCGNRLLDDNISAFKPILSLAFECELEIQEDRLIQILRDGVVSETSSTYESDSDTMETGFLTKVNSAVKRLHNNGKSQCPFIVMIVDLVEDSFSHDIQKLDKDKDFSEFSDLLENLIVSQSLLQKHKFDLQFLVACAFFKAFTKYLSRDLDSANEKIGEYVNALLARKGDSNTVSSMECYIVKCLCHGKLRGHATKEIHSLAEKVSNLKLLLTPVTDGLRDCSIDRCPLLFFLSPARQKDILILMDQANDDHLSFVKSLVDDIHSKEDGLLVLLGYAERFLYTPRSYQVLDAKIKTNAREISEQTGKSSLDIKHAHFLKCLLGTDELIMAYLRQSEQSSLGDCLLNTFLISLFALCFVHGVKENETFFQICLKFPCKLKGHFLPGYPDTDETEPSWSPLNLNINQEKIDDCQFTNCECQHRIVILQPFIEDAVCPVCSKLLHIGVSSDTIEIAGTASTGFTTGNIQQTFYAIRNLSPLSCQILFLMIKGCLIGSLALNYELPEHLENILGISAVDLPQPLWTDSEQHWQNIAKLLGVDKYSVGIFLQTILLHTQELVFDKSSKMTSESERLLWEELFEKSVQSVVENRFVYQREMVRHYRFLSNESNVLEDALLEVDENPDESFSTIFRQKGRPSFDNFVSELYPLREKFPLLCLVMSRENELHLPAHIKPIMQWHMAVASTTNYAMRKHECLSMTVTDFIQQTGDKDKEKTDILRRRFEQLQKSWTYLKQNLEKGVTEDMIPLHGNLKMEQCTIFTKTCKLYKLLLHLVGIQNDILDHILTLSKSCESVHFLMRSESMAMVPYVNIADLTEMHLLQIKDSNLNWSELIKLNSQCDTGYGKGQKVWYDFKAIEKLLVQRLIPGKAYIIFSTLPQIVFTDELYKNYVALSNDIKRKVTQKSLGSDILSALDEKQKGDPRICKELMVQVGMIMTLLNKTGGDPSKCLIDYIEEMKNVLTKKFSEDLLPSPTTAIKLGHIVALHDKLEEINAETMIDALDDEYRFNLDCDQKNLFETMVNTNKKLANYVLCACKRFINRCLSLREAGANRPLLEHVAEASFWPEGVFIGESLRLGDTEEQLVDVIPITVMVKNIYHLVKLIETEIEYFSYIMVTGHVLMIPELSTCLVQGDCKEREKNIDASKTN